MTDPAAAASPPRRTVHAVVPAGIDDPARPSGGNVYDRRLCEELPRWGWTVREHLVPGTWPNPEPSDLIRFAALLAGLPENAVVLVDGLMASVAESLVSDARRLRLVVLLHMPLAEASPQATTNRVEAGVLNAAAAVVATSAWTRDWVVAHHGVAAERLWVANPGADRARPARGSATGGNLLCAGPVTPAKGHDVLVAALAEVADLVWHCTCAGALDLEPRFVESLMVAAESAGIAERFVLTGALARRTLDKVRSKTDLVISSSRREAYGMSVSEGLACGIPVIATDVGGHREAVGWAPDGTLPGMLVPVGDSAALAAALRRWLTDAATRTRLRSSAGLRGKDLPDWSKTARTVSAVLEAIRTEPDPASSGI